MSLATIQRKVRPQKEWWDYLGFSLIDVAPDSPDSHISPDLLISNADPIPSHPSSPPYHFEHSKPFYCDLKQIKAGQVINC